MTPQEKAEATRREHQEARRAKEAAAAEDLKLIRKSLEDVLHSDEATPAEKLESSKLLLELTKHPKYGYSF